jgi:hypothetical protein
MAIVWPRSSTARSAQNLEVAQRFGNFVYYTFVTNLSLRYVYHPDLQALETWQRIG